MGFGVCCDVGCGPGGPVDDVRAEPDDEQGEAGDADPGSGFGEGATSLGHADSAPREPAVGLGSEEELACGPQHRDEHRE